MGSCYPLQRILGILYLFSIKEVDHNITNIEGCIYLNDGFLPIHVHFTES